MDELVRCLCRKSNIRFDLVELTATSKELCRRHLSGPTAAQVMAQGLVAVALLSGDLSDESERVAMQFQVDGPVGGFMTEATFAGTLRGYTVEKVMNQFDGEDLSELSPALGTKGGLSAICSTSEKIVYSGQVAVSPPNIRAGLAKYLNESLQTPSAVELFSSTNEGYLDAARGMVAQKMPDGDTETFVRVLERFDDKSVAKALAGGCNIDTMKNIFELPELEIVELRPLSFACNCSKQKIIDVVKTLSEEELRDMATSEEKQLVTCHFCGETYAIPPSGIMAILDRKLGGGE